MRTFLKTHAMTFSILLTLGVSLGIQAQAFQADSKKPEAEAIDVVGEKPLSFRKELEKAQREYVEIMVEKINSSPELLQAYQQMELAKQQYQRAKDI